MTQYKKGMVFGVFDNFHPGHRYYIAEAAKRCEELVVVVTRSEVVEQLKHRRPKQSDFERMKNIRNFYPPLKVALGDEVLGSWNILRAHQPEMIFLGYDQHGIAKELKKMNIKYEFLDSHEPEKFKSSLMK
jgi:cytidyltransferase-like protein